MHALWQVHTHTLTHTHTHTHAHMLMFVLCGRGNVIVGLTALVQTFPLLLLHPCAPSLTHLHVCTHTPQPVNNADFVVPVEIDGIVHQVYVLKRPHCDEFLKRMGEMFECILFTASLAKVRSFLSLILFSITNCLLQLQN